MAVIIDLQRIRPDLLIKLLEKGLEKLEKLEKKGNINIVIKIVNTKIDYLSYIVINGIGFDVEPIALPGENKLVHYLRLHFYIYDSGKLLKIFDKIDINDLINILEDVIKDKVISNKYHRIRRKVESKLRDLLDEIGDEDDKNTIAGLLADSIYLILSLSHRSDKRDLRDLFVETILGGFKNALIDICNMLRKKDYSAISLLAATKYNRWLKMMEILVYILKENNINGVTKYLEEVREKCPNARALGI